MSYNLSNDLTVAVYFGRTEFPLDANNRLISLHITESVQLYIPQMKLELTDSSGFLERLGLQDGSPITVSISSQGQIIHSMTFRVFSFKIYKENAVQAYSIQAYFDIPKYWLGLAEIQHRGTSHEALQKIAADCGLEFAGVQTSDHQLWTPGCTKNADYAKYIADRGYVSNTSCMVLGINLKKQMIYFDIMNLNPPTVVLRSLETKSDDEYIVPSFKVSYYSGMNVLTGGYYTTQVSQSAVKSKAMNSVIDRVEVTSNVKAPMVNTTVRGLFSKQIIRYLPIDGGNVSDNYDKALYQNRRLKSMFTVNGEFLLNRPSPLTLCIPFTFYATTENGEPSIKDSGVYITCAKILYIANGIYTEKIAASRIGTNANYYAN